MWLVTVNDGPHLAELLNRVKAIHQAVEITQRTSSIAVIKLPP